MRQFLVERKNGRSFPRMKRNQNCQGSRIGSQTRGSDLLPVYSKTLWQERVVEMYDGSSIWVIVCI